MRITGGAAKGRVLKSLRGIKIRPTSDMVREAIFSLLGQDLTGRNVLDLFAGSGSLGLEALSRGASWALFIDYSVQSINMINKNLHLLGFKAMGAVIKKDLRRGLSFQHPYLKKRFDLVFLDPPYGMEFLLPLLKGISERGLLSPSSEVVTESSKDDLLPARLKHLHLINSRTYGETKIDIYHVLEK